MKMVIMAQKLLDTKKASAASMNTQSAAGPSKTAGHTLILNDGDDTDCMSSFLWQSYTDSNFVKISIRSLMLHPSKDREELNKLLHTSNVISMRLLSIEFDSKLLITSGKDPSA
jgi:hypothetical protein